MRSRAKKPKKELPDNVVVSARIDRGLYIALDAFAKRDRRSIPNAVAWFVNLGIRYDFKKLAAEDRHRRKIQLAEARRNSAVAARKSEVWKEVAAELGRMGVLT